MKQPYKLDLLQEDAHGFTPYHMIKLNGAIKYLQSTMDYEIDYLENLIKYYQCYQQSDLPKEAKFYLGPEAYDQFDITLSDHPILLQSLQEKLNYIQLEKENLKKYLELKKKFNEPKNLLNLKVLSPEDINILIIYASIFIDVKIIYQLYEYKHKYYPELPVDINARDQDGNTALHYLCGSKNFSWEFINTLLRFYLRQPEINPNIQNNKGYTPLIFACYNGNEDIGKILLDYGVDVNLVNFKNESALMMACRCIKFALIKYLLECHAEVDLQDQIHGDTPLTIISKFYYSHRSLQLLVEKGHANVNLCNWKGESPLLISCFTSNINNVRLFVEHGANINIREKSKGLCPLMIVFNRFNYYLANYFLEHGANINQINDEGDTPLIFTCKLYNKYGSELLLQYHADTSIRNREGLTAKDILNKNGFNFVIGL